MTSLCSKPKKSKYHRGYTRRPDLLYLQVTVCFDCMNVFRKLRQIAEAETIITNQIICTKCGAAGHIAKDCVQRAPAEIAQQQMVAGIKSGDLPVNTIVGRQDRAKMDSEYMSLMAELGQVSESLSASMTFESCIL